MKRLFVSWCVLSTMAVYGQGWQPDQLLYFAPAGQPDQKQSCGQLPTTKVMICVYEAGLSGNLHIYEIQSANGGVSWSAPVRVTNESGGEFDPYIAIDPYRNRLWMVYSRNAPPGNNLIIRQKSCASCSWSSGTTVIGDGANHWDASLLVLSNGDLLALEQLEGPGGTAQGKIRSIRSSDGGYTWQSPSIIIDESGHETFPRAVQKIDGVIHLVFRDSSHGSRLQIGQLWSGDYGHTWQGHSVFQYNYTQDQWATFVGSQGGNNVTVIARISGYINHWVSWDNGSTWGGPYRVSDIIADAWDGEMAMGCRGPIFTLSDGTMNFWEKRYDWYTSCQ